MPKLWLMKVFFKINLEYVYSTPSINVTKTTFVTKLSRKKEGIVN